VRSIGSHQSFGPLAARSCSPKPLLKIARNSAVFFQQGKRRISVLVQSRTSRIEEMRKPITIPPTPAAGPLAVSPAEAGRLVGVGRTTIYAAISSGELRSVKIGTRRLVAVDALREWLLAHEVVQ
jgi:excisionase family DNA binding protein